MSFSSTRPNLLFIMPDQLRADFLGCYGAGFMHTPNIDRLAAQGVRYERAYSEHPVCVPARCALVTGINGLKTGVLDNGQFLRPDYERCGVYTWPQLLSDQGYHTVATGKMHFYPWERRLGFHHRIIAEDKLWGYIQDDYHHFLAARGYHKRMFIEGPGYHESFGAGVSPLPWECTIDHFVGQETVKWIEAYEGKEPFAMMVGFPGPHSPYDPAAEYATLSLDDVPEPLPAVEADTEGMRGGAFRRGYNAGRRTWYAVRNDRKPGKEDFMRQRAHYGGLVHQIDYEVGCILAALERKGVLDNTVIVFSADHGDYLGDHGLQGKASYYEAACRVPLLVRWPQRSGPALRRELVCLSDVTATLLQAAECSPPGYMDSAALPGLGLAEAQPRETVVGILRNGWMALDGTWKLCKYAGGAVHLFNLTEDPAEQENRARDRACAAVYQRLDAVLTESVMRLTDEGNFPQRVYDFSYSSSPEFGRVGWERTYPMPWTQLYPEGG